MADHSLFIFVRVQGATPEAVGNTLRTAATRFMDIYSIMGEWDLLVRIEHPDLNAIQNVVTETIRANPNVAQTYTILGYQIYGSKWPGFDYPDTQMTLDLEAEYNNRARVPEQSRHHRRLGGR